MLGTIKRKHDYPFYQSKKQVIIDKKEYKQNDKTRLYPTYNGHIFYHIPTNNGMVKVNNEEFYGKEYLEMIASRHPVVNMKPNLVGGMPVVHGTRIQVSLIIACLRDEMTIDEVCEDYELDRDEVKRALEYAIDVLDYPFDED